MNQGLQATRGYAWTFSRYVPNCTVGTRQYGSTSPAHRPLSTPPTLPEIAHVSASCSTSRFQARRALTTPHYLTSRIIHPPKDLAHTGKMNFAIEVPGEASPLSLPELCKALEAATSMDNSQRQAAGKQLSTWETQQNYFPSLQVRCWRCFCT